MGTEQSTLSYLSIYKKLYPTIHSTQVIYNYTCITVVIAFNKTISTNLKYIALIKRYNCMYSILKANN